MRYDVRITEPAEEDLRDIFRYISRVLLEPQIAQKTIATLKKSILALSDMPQGRPLVADDRLSSMGYRKLIVKNYIVFFTVDEREKMVYVERVLYGRRDWVCIL